MDLQLDGVLPAFVLYCIPVGATIWILAPGQPPLAVPPVRSALRLRRRKLRVVDDQHQRLLPATPQGLGAGPQRRRWQPGRARGPVDRSHDGGLARRRSAILGLRDLPLPARARPVSAALKMDNLELGVDVKAMGRACNRNTWIIAALYIATFGSFIGYSFSPSAKCWSATSGPRGHGATGGAARRTRSPSSALCWVRSARSYGVKLADRIGGSKVTFGVFIGMTASSTILIFSEGSLAPTSSASSSCSSCRAWVMARCTR